MQEQERHSDRKDQRRRLIVETARAAFFRNGYGGTTMSSIAADLGGSKATLWSYFRNKQDLFTAVIDDMVERYGEALRMPLPAEGDPVETLRRFASSLMKTIITPARAPFCQARRQKYSMISEAAASEVISA